MAEDEVGNAQTRTDPQLLEPLDDQSFATLQTLSFVSPAAFGEHARKVRCVTDNHEERITALEARNIEDQILAKLTALFENKLAGMMRGFQDQVRG
jgi:hypothetical protein